MTGITIRTRLDDGIYRSSSGGGEIRVRCTWSAGPLNLLRAARKLPEHKAAMVAGYGNIGAGSSWLQIGEQRVHSDDLPETLEQARSLLERVQSGQYAVDLAATAACMAQMQAEADARSAEVMAEEMREMSRRAAEEETRQREAEQAAQAAAEAHWLEQQQREAADHAAWRGATDARQAAREIARGMRRDWRRAGC